MKQPETRTRRIAVGALAALAIALGLERPAKADPPQMKEESAVPRLGVESKDGSMALALGGFLQARYGFAAKEGEHIEPELVLPRARFYAFGRIAGERVRYRIGMGNPPGTTQVELLDVYAEIKALPEVRLRAGRFKIPVVREWVEAARLLASVERSTVTQAVLPGREIGLLVAGEPLGGHLDYAVGFFGGRGDRPTPSTSRVPSAAARIVWNVLGRGIEGEADFEGSEPALSVGASAFTTFASPNDAPTDSLHARGVEIAFRAHGFDLAFEAMERADALGHTRGAYLRGDYYVRPLKSTVGLRAVRRLSSEPGGTSSELSVDLGYYPLGHDLKLIGDVGLAHVRGTYEPFATAQLQVGF